MQTQAIAHRYAVDYVQKYDIWLFSEKHAFCMQQEWLWEIFFSGDKEDGAHY